MRQLWILLALALSIPAAPGAAEIIGPARVIDGQTLEIDDREIRLYGVDAPDSRQTCEWDSETVRCGALARDAMLGLIADAEVQCDFVAKDGDRRLVAVCQAHGRDIGGSMVVAGWALAYRQQSEKYVAMEDQAREAKRGLWQGKFVPPWEWRLRERH